MEPIPPLPPPPPPWAHPAAPFRGATGWPPGQTVRVPDGTDGPPIPWLRRPIVLLVGAGLLSVVIMALPLWQHG